MEHVHYKNISKNRMFILKRQLVLQEVLLDIIHFISKHISCIFIICTVWGIWKLHVNITRILTSFTDDTISIASTLSNHSHDQHHQETISSIWKNMKSLNRDKRATQTLVADVWMTSVGSFEFALCFVLGFSANWIKINIYFSDFFYFF